MSERGTNRTFEPRRVNIVEVPEPDIEAEIYLVASRSIMSWARRSSGSLPVVTWSVPDMSHRGAIHSSPLVRWEPRRAAIVACPI